RLPPLRHRARRGVPAAPRRRGLPGGGGVLGHPAWRRGDVQPGLALRGPGRAAARRALARVSAPAPPTRAALDADLRGRAWARLPERRGQPGTLLPGGGVLCVAVSAPLFPLSGEMNEPPRWPGSLGRGAAEVVVAEDGHQAILELRGQRASSHQRLASDEAGLVGGQEQRCLADVARAARAAERVGEHPVAEQGWDLANVLLLALGHDPARADGVAADALGAEVDRDHHPRPRGGEDARGALADAPRRAGDDRHPAGQPPAPVRHAQLPGGPGSSAAGGVPATGAAPRRSHRARSSSYWIALWKLASSCFCSPRSLPKRSLDHHTSASTRYSSSARSTCSVLSEPLVTRASEVSTSGGGTDRPAM